MNLAEVASVAAAVIAAVGLGHAWARNRRADRRAAQERPRLSIESHVFGYGVRLRISNAAGRLTARNVEVLVTEASENPQATAELPVNASPVRRVNRPLQWRDGETKVDVPGNLTREIDVLTFSIPEEDGVVPTATLETEPSEPLSLGVHRDRLSELLRIVPGLDAIKDEPARVRLTIVGDNVEATHYTLIARFSLEAPVYSSNAIFNPGLFLSNYEVRLLDGHAAHTRSPHERDRSLPHS